jgi:hypothetical protein
MKCNNCNIDVANEFSFAIKSNQCPACGRQIMQAEKLAAYIGLKQLIKNNFSGVDSEKVANLVVANFELKQLFKEDSPNQPIASREDVEIEVSEELTDKESDEMHKMNQVAQAKTKLKQMKQEAFEEALKEQYGMGESDIDEGQVTGADSFFSEENLSAVQLTDRLEKAQRQADSKREMLSGAGGFRRSDV